MGRLAVAALVGFAWAPSTWAATISYTDPTTGVGVAAMWMDSGPTRPEGFEPSTVGGGWVSQSTTMLTNVPTSTWTYGCSATSAGMMFGYYDLNGYPNMYTGDFNGGVVPTTDLGSQCSLIATRKGFDGRTTRGHVDDYWISSGSAGPDPWEGNWTEHTWGDCTADYLGTSQWKWDFLNDDDVIDFNTDGGTALWLPDSADKLYDPVPPADAGLPQTALCHGLRLFAESRGYTVIENYTQRIDTLYPGGFSFADYQAEIDAGCPVMIQVTGHSMVGVGYGDSNTVYLHDTWDNSVHTMTWGESYAGRDHLAMTVIHVGAPVPEPGMLVLFGLGTLVLGLRRRGRA